MSIVTWLINITKVIGDGSPNPRFVIIKTEISSTFLIHVINKFNTNI